ncbi:flavin reductase family protein [Candidatus Poribacteria bacterium]
MSDKIEASYTDYLKETLDTVRNPGLLLVAADADGKPNAMTIGWGTVGIIWGKPIFIVLVRPSRYTYGLMEQSDDFTVNVPSAELRKAVAFCGSQSGRDYDKFAEMEMTAVPGRKVKSPIIDECVIHYECKIVHKNNVLKDELASEIVSSAYSSGDFHTIYYGEILSVYASPDAREKL